MRWSKLKKPQRIFGKDGVTLRLINEVIDRINALGDIRVTKAKNNRVLYASDNVTIELPRTKAGGSGGGGTVSVNPFQLTTSRPGGYPDSGSGLRVWVEWGTVYGTGNASPGVVPDNIFDPISIPTSSTSYVWLEISIAESSGSYNVTSVTINSGTTQPTQSDPDSETGEPPSTIYFLLGQVESDSSNITAVLPTGSGSIGLYVYTENYTCLPGDSENGEAGGITTVKNFALYRV